MKIIIGVALIAAAVVTTIATGGAGAIAALGLVEAIQVGGMFAGMLVATTLVGAELMISGIAQELSFGQGSGFAVRGQAASDWIIVFGRQRIGGAQVDCSVSGSGNRWLWEVIAHSAAPIESFDAVYLNGQQAFLQSGTNGLTGNHSGTSNTDYNNTGTSGNVQNIQCYDSNWQKYDNFYWDGNARFYIEQYDGTQTEASPFYVANCYYNNGTAHWNSNCILKGTAYSILRYWWNANYMGNPPTVTQDVHGCNVIYDPRLDPEPGVNTTHPSYLIYTENAALILAYYLTNTKFGAGFLWSDINIEQLIAAANVCDEMIPLANPLVINGVSVTSEHQYTINACIDSSQSSGDVINNMLQSMQGNLSYVGGQWNIFPAAWYGTPTSVITSTSFVQPMKYSPKKKARDLFNEVRGQFISPAAFTTTMGPGIDVYENTTLFNNFNAQWQKSDMVPYSENLARNYAVNQWLEQDNNVSYIMNTTYPMTISNATCQRLSKIMLRRNRWQGSGTLNLSLANYNITPVDNIALDYPRYGWTQKLFTVTSASVELGAGKDSLTPPVYQIGIQETDPSIYEWCVNSEVLLNDTNEGTTVITDEIANTPNGLSQAGATVALCAPVTDLVAESGSSTMVTTSVGISSPAILCTWTPPVTIQATNSGGYTTGTPNEMVVYGGHYNVQVSTNSAVTWNAVTTISGDSTSYSITGLSDGTIAYIRVQAAQENGLLSEWNQVGPVTVSDTTLNVSAADVYYGNQGNLLTFAGVNIVPDSNLQFGWTYWTQPDSGWSIEQVISTANPNPASPVPGCNAFVITPALNSGTYNNATAPITLTVGQQYTLSGFIDAYYVTAGTPGWVIYDFANSTEYAGLNPTPGTTGRISTTFTFNPSGVTAGTQVSLSIIFDCETATFTNQILASAPMIQLGNTMTAYIAGVASLNSQSGLAHGTMSSAVQSAVTSTGIVQNLGGTSAASITPIAGLMPAQAGADVTNQNLASGTTGGQIVQKASTYTTSNPFSAPLVNDSANGSTWGNVATFTAGWSNQTPISIATGFSATTYDVYVRIRSNGTGNQPTAVQFGVYSSYSGGEYVLATTVATSTTYQVEYAGQVTFTQAQLTAGSNTYFSQAGITTEYYVDYVLFTPTVQNLGGVPTSSITPVSTLVTTGTSSVLNRQGNLTGYGNLTFSYTSTTTTIVVNWSAFDLYRSDGSITSISSGSYTFNSLTASTTYDIGCSLNISTSALDNWMKSATTAGDATTFSQQTLVTVFNADGQIGLLVGGAGAQATTAATTGGTGGGTGGSPKGCPAIEMFIDDTTMVGEVVVGQFVDCLDSQYPVETIRYVLQPCMEITTATGHSLLCSNSTPFVLQDGTVKSAEEIDGEMVLTDTGQGTEKVWMLCKARQAGMHIVGVIFVGNKVYAAGAEANKRIYSHNQKIVPYQVY